MSMGLSPTGYPSSATAHPHRVITRMRHAVFAGYLPGMDGKSWAVAGVVLGIGVGGFVDGIVAHQLLEWHHMLSSWYPLDGEHNIRVNMVGDALFHLFCLLVVLVGIGLLARARHPDGRGRRLVGWMIAGWGVFNLVEGVVDHLLLGVHHVRSGPDQLAYDLGFLALGVVLLVGGAWLGRSRPAQPAPETNNPVQRHHLRRLLDSDLQEPVLVLSEGHAEVVPAADQERAGFAVVSRTEFLHQAGKSTFTDAELDQQAITLSTSLAKLGG
jgi:uncharacterized membrane protein